MCSNNKFGLVIYYLEKPNCMSNPNKLRLSCKVCDTSVKYLFKYKLTANVADGSLSWKSVVSGNPYIQLPNDNYLPIIFILRLQKSFGSKRPEKSSVWMCQFASII